ncbi:hypothetical protein GCM10025771_15770 [Niveibacterium umoris]|uniref:histidine kinase n=1 Tax=Niveibacterium umoris TaxID=1193620 RepID=A0A840BPJ9_9RHOO|nr:ATP-binding protein [Niveibacterium umoris]MBB4014553.1 PAS domain S-box-containing protein [Niveibacterium umoris]
MRDTWRRLIELEASGAGFGRGDQLATLMRDLLVVIGLLTLAFVLFMAASGWYSSPTAMYSLLAALAFWPLFFAMLRRGIVRAVAVVLMLLCTAIALSVALRLGTIRVLQMSGCFIAIVIATLVLGRRAGALALVGVLGLLWGAGQIQLEHGGAGDSRLMIYNQAATFSFFAIMMYATLVVVRQHFASALLARDRSADEQRLTRAALEESEDKFATLFREGPLPALIVAPDSGTVREVNYAWLALTGQREAAVLGASVDALGLLDNAEPLLPSLVALARGAPAIVARPLSLSLPDRPPLQCELSAQAVPVRGRVLVILQCVDVTARNRAEQQVRESEERFATAFELSPDAWTLHDFASGKYMAVNRAWEQWSGYSRGEAVGHTPLELGIVPDASTMARIMDAIRVGGGGLENLDLYFWRRSGERRRCSMSARLFVIGQARYLITSSRDTTEDWQNREALAALNQGLESKVAERTAELESVNRELILTVAELGSAQDELVRQEKLASLGAMVAGVAHELNTPIGNSVTLATTMAHETRVLRHAVEAGALRRSALLGFLRTCDEATSLLTRNLEAAHELISSFKQVAVDQTSEQRRVFSFAHSLEEIVAMQRPAFRNGHVGLELELSGDLQLDSFPGALARVVSNLVENARIHGFGADSAGLVRVIGRVAGPDRVELEVCDDGCGIPIEHQRKVFDPFFTTRLGQGGSGLGMHIVFTLVTQVLGGRIVLESAPGRGARFVVTLPRVAPEAQINGDAQAMAIAPAKQDQRKQGAMT